MKLLIDTNFILIPFTKHTDVIDALSEDGEVYIPDFCVEELRKLGKEKIVNSYIKLKKIKVLETKFKNNCGADKYLLELSKNGYVICTQDSELRKKIKQVGGKIIYLRQNRYIEKNF